MTDAARSNILITLNLAIVVLLFLLLMRPGSGGSASPQSNSCRDGDRLGDCQVLILEALAAIRDNSGSTTARCKVPNVTIPVFDDCDQLIVDQLGAIGQALRFSN